MNTLQYFLYCVWTNWARFARLAANESSFKYPSNDPWFQLISCTANDKSQIKKVPYLYFALEFHPYISRVSPLLQGSGSEWTKRIFITSLISRLHCLIFQNSLQSLFHLCLFSYEIFFLSDLVQNNEKQLS